MNQCACGRPALYAMICNHCTKTMRVALRHIGGYLLDMSDIARRETRFGDNSGKGSIGKEQPLILDTRFADKTGTGSQLEYDARATLVAWCRTVMDEWPEYHPGPICELCKHHTCTQARRRRWPIDTTTSMCAYLLRMASTIAAEMWAPDLLDELLDLEKRLRKFVDRPSERWYAGICGNPLADDREHNGTTCGCDCHNAVGLPCDVPGGCGLEYAVVPGARCDYPLWAAPGTPFVRCRECGHTWATTERKATLLDEARDRVLTLEVILQIAETLGTPAMRSPKNPERVRQWAARGKVRVLGERVVHGKPRPIYRVGDVLDLLDPPRDTPDVGSSTG